MNRTILLPLVGTARWAVRNVTTVPRAGFSLSAIAVIALGVIVLVGCQRAAPPTTPEVVIVATADLPSAPTDPAWQTAPEHVARLLLQDMVEPRLLQPSTAEVRVRALAAGADVAFRLEWADASPDDRATPSTFVDACAVQVPRSVAPDVPAPQMGERDRPVEITYWSAAWQAVVDGRGDTIQAVYPNAAVDHYPFEAAPLEPGSAVQREMAARYAPARALGNTMAGPRETPVQDLVAEGPGTLTPAPATTSTGRGQRTPTGWAVVITRRLPADLTAPTRSQIAFAVWQGAADEVGARKMRTGWIPLSMEVTP